jgi:hypothetical protein
MNCSIFARCTDTLVNSLCFITSKQKDSNTEIACSSTPQHGLKVPILVLVYFRFSW